MANTLISKTFSSAGNRKTWTWSAWIKIIANTSYTYTLMTQVDGWSGNGNGGFYLNGESLETYNLLSNVNAGDASRVSTNAMLRDPNGWYHVVLRFDTTQSTASDRVRWYINGELQTSLKYANYPSQNFDANFNTATAHGIGRHTNSSTYPYEGSMSHIHFCDGQSYAPTEFGQYDANGVWKINTSPSVTYGTNGFFILKDGNSVTDQSGNGNNFTVGGGTLTNTEDCPSNVFATLNPLDNYYQSSTFTEGNNTVEHGQYPWTYNTSTLKIPEATKFYCEGKVITMNQNTCGIASNVTTGNGDSNTSLGNITGGVAFRGNQGDIQKEGSLLSGTWTTFTTNDIIQIACDTVNNKLYFGKNGTWLNNGDPTSGASGTGAISITDNTDYFFAFGDNTSGARGKWSINFGNGYFGTTAVSSAGTNASGIGIFEYDVPTGYTALSTKGLNL